MPVFVHFRYNRANRDLQAKDKALLAAESQVNDLQARLNDAVSQRKHWENEYHVSLLLLWSFIGHLGLT